MENKKTTELLDLLQILEKESETKDDFDWDKHGKVLEELVSRYPFSEILGEKEQANEFTLEERIENLEDKIKQLRRHKHDDKNGDVLIRI